MRHRFAALFLAIIMITTSATDTASALAPAPDFYDENFYSLNNIGWFDPRCSEETTAKYVQLAGRDNTEKILNFFMRKTYKGKQISLAQAAGIVGNMKQESGLNPAIREGGRIVDNSYVLEPNVGFGLVQWTSPGRQQNFMKFMKELGVGVTDLSGQLEFTWKEMNDGYSHVLDALIQTEEPVVSAVIIHGRSDVGSNAPDYRKAMQLLNHKRGYEISADDGDKVVKIRGGTAKEVHDKYADAPALAGSTADDTMLPAGTGSDRDAASMAAVSTKDEEKQQCVGSSSSTAGGGFTALVKAYAWSEFIAPRSSISTMSEAQGKSIKATDKKPAYADAVNKALASKPRRYVGGYEGVDCGGFVTTLVYDSGHDKKYNTNATGGNTLSQEAWLRQNWKPISATDANDRQAGDVAINEDHTYIYVGKIDGFGSTIASASLGDRAPMAGKEGVTDNSFRWYRKK